MGTHLPSHDRAVLDWRYLVWGRGSFPDWSRLRVARLYAGLSQEELADAVHCTRKTISSLERGRSTPSLALAKALADTLGLPVDELFP